MSLKFTNAIQIKVLESLNNVKTIVAQKSVRLQVTSGT